MTVAPALSILVGRITEIGEGHLVVGAGTRVALPSGQSFKGLSSART